MPRRDSAARISRDRWYVAWTSIMSDTSGVWILLDCWAGCKHNEPPATSINYAPVNSFRIHARARVYAHIRTQTRIYVHTFLVHEGVDCTCMHTRDMYRLAHSVAPTYSQHVLTCQIDLLRWRLTCLPTVCGIHFAWFLDLNLHRALVKGQTLCVWSTTCLVMRMSGGFGRN